MEKDEEEELFVATYPKSGEVNEEQLVDSGCTNHMTHDKEKFLYLQEICFIKVILRDGSLIYVKGEGSRRLEST